MIMRVARWTWPLVFLIPLTLVAKRGCEFPGVDATYHTVMWLHQNLPLLFLVAGTLSAVVVLVRVSRARAKAVMLFSLATPLPPVLQSAFETEAARLSMGVPRVAYLDVAAPLCFTIVGLPAAVILSRGFLDDLEEAEIRLAVRHELVHVKRGDPLRGFAWHIGFAALLLPAFSELERWLAARRELRTNVEAAIDDPERYSKLLRSRARNRAHLCVEAFGHSERYGTLAGALAQPMIVVVVLAALAYSHAWFLEHLAFLSRNHC